MGNKEIEYINAIREVEEKWNGTEEELKMEMEEVGYFSKTMDNTEILSDYYRELSDVYEELNAEHYHELAHIEEVHQLKQKELQVVSEKYANKIAKLRKEMYVEY